MPDYKWFGQHTSQEGIDQGLILVDFPVPDYSKVDYVGLASDENVELPVEIKKYDLIIMSQACDIENDKVKNITLCRIYTLKEYLVETNQSKTKAKELLNSLNSGRVVNMCLLNRPDYNPYGDAFEDYLIVKFDESVNYPVELIRQRISNETGNMMKLMPPYRESLSQNYGIFYMRVGNPKNIPKVTIDPYNDFLSQFAVTD